MQRRITSGTTIHLEPVDGADPLEGPVFAINWFNTKRAWLYHFYNFLAARPVIRVGARVLIKGRVQKRLLGAEKDHRDMLLVVYYRSGEDFLDLLSRKFFQAISIFRQLAVRDFSFVFHKRRDGADRIEPAPAAGQGHKAYAIHHFRSDGPVSGDLARIASLIEDHPVSVFFASEKTATLAAESQAGKRRTAPFETHKVVIFEAADGMAIETCLCSGAYRDFAKSLDFSYMAALERTL